MSLLRALILSICWIELQAAVHDDVPQCGLSGVYKTRQSLLLSPNYPNNYPPNTCWDYIVRSPYRCPTKFHIQFLAFTLESSENCTNDYLAVGLDSESEDMDILCGQVIGIKKYNTPDGILRLRFMSDDSPWTTSKGFKLLVTRLACERPNSLRNAYDDTEELEAPSNSFAIPENGLPDLFQNLSLQEQYQEYIPPALQLPTTIYPGLAYLPQFEPPAAPVPCEPNQASNPYYPQQNPFQNFPTDQYLRSNSKAPGEDLTRQSNGIGLLPSLERCCLSPFQNQEFYLSSPGFPKTVLTALLPTQRRDCQFILQKFSQRVCRLRLNFRFFDFGHTYSYSGLNPSSINTPIGNTRDLCTEDFLEIDGERFCGCRTGYVYTSPWLAEEKLIRMRMGYSGIPSNGFLLDITQEECLSTEFSPGLSGGVSNIGGQTLNTPISNGVAMYPLYAVQRQPIYTPQTIYRPYQTLTQQSPWQFGIRPTQFPYLRQSRTAKSQKSEPLKVVETNSTRKEFYYSEELPEAQVIQERSGNAQSSEDPPRKNENLYSLTRGRCVFSTTDIFKLFVDPLWIRKPTCYSPQRNWFTNMFG